MSLFLTNTLTQRKEEFKPLSDTVNIYICGMTVQGPPHFGHMRAYITSDILIRYLEFSGYKIKVVQNFTDIDDKVIEKSLEEKIDYRVIAEKNIQEYYEVADKMGIRRVDIYPKATQHIQEIIELIEKLIAKGYAYEVKGDVYFEVDKFSDYGKLSKKKLDDLIAGARVEIRKHKKNPADFALWKASKENEPWWESPWGKGRPGWAIECSAMSMHYLGETLDLHLGGEDLIFPHHENEIAQSEAATGKPFVRYWIHNAMLNLTGEKMSKSTKHFITAKEMLAKYSPNVLRLYFLKSHYRSPQEFDYKILDSCKESWEKIQNFLNTSWTETQDFLNQKNKIHNYRGGSEFAKTMFKKAMDDDLNTPKVIAFLFGAIKDGFISIQNKHKESVTKLYFDILFLLHKLGFKPKKYYKPTKGRFRRIVEKYEFDIESNLLNEATALFKQGHQDIAWLIQLGVPQKDTGALIYARAKLRQIKKYETADLIRMFIEGMGYILEDTDNGTITKRKS